MRFSLRQLEVFLATARYENVTRAAQRCPCPSSLLLKYYQSST